MSNDNLLLGVFALVSGLSISTLCHYDELDLLRPHLLILLPPGAAAPAAAPGDGQGAAAKKASWPEPQRVVKQTELRRSVQSAATPLGRAAMPL